MHGLILQLTILVTVASLSANIEMKILDMTQPTEVKYKPLNTHMTVDEYLQSVDRPSTSRVVKENSITKGRGVAPFISPAKSCKVDLQSPEVKSRHLNTYMSFDEYLQSINSSSANSYVETDPSGPILVDSSRLSQSSTTSQNGKRFRLSRFPSRPVIIDSKLFKPSTSYLTDESSLSNFKNDAFSTPLVGSDKLSEPSTSGLSDKSSFIYVNKDGPVSIKTTCA